MYRISSRSFPNRTTLFRDDKVTVVPKEGHESDLMKNPYIAYNCIRTARNHAVISNGSHTDTITEKIAMGYSARDALALSLLAMDYEKDEFCTPRIAGVINRVSNMAWLATIRVDTLYVRSFELRAGDLFYVATYEHNTPCKRYCDADFDTSSVSEAKDYIMRKGIFAGFEKPVTSAAILSTGTGFAISADN
jgi:IMP cyclohydrolase